jgi:copper(I)-binding protein
MSFARSCFAPLITAAGLAITVAAHAQEFHKGSLAIEKPYATTTAPGQPNGAIFIKEIRNAGKEADELIGAKSSASKSIELHRMSMENSVMSMREIPGIAIPAAGKVSMDRGSKDGFHLMLMGLARPLKEGESFSATLVFRKAGEVPITVSVEKLKTASHGHRH